MRNCADIFKREICRATVFLTKLNGCFGFPADYLGVGFNCNICGVGFAGVYIFSAKTFCHNLLFCPRGNTNFAKIGYFENDINGWIKDTWTLVRYAPWQTLAVGAILWLPIVVIIWFPQWGILALMVFVAVYYAVMGVIATALLKNPQVRILKNKREEEQ